MLLSKIVIGENALIKLIGQWLVVLILFCSPFSFSKEIAGIDIAETHSVAQTQLVLNGAGVRSKFFMDLYVGSLYLKTSETIADKVIRFEETMMVQLDITSGMITSERMIEAIEEGFDNATNGNRESIDKEIELFISIFSEPIKIKDNFQLLYQPQYGLTVFKNNQIINEQAISPEFKRALFAIWLGDKPAQKSLKNAMLGK